MQRAAVGQQQQLYQKCLHALQVLLLLQILLLLLLLLLLRLVGAILPLLPQLSLLLQPLLDLYAQRCCEGTQRLERLNLCSRQAGQASRQAGQQKYHPVKVEAVDSQTAAVCP